MISKGPNGATIPDEFAAAHLSDLPKSTRAGRVAAPVDEGTLEKVRMYLKDPDGVIRGGTLYTATVKELTDYNAKGAAAAALSGATFVAVASLEALAKRFAFNGAGNIRRYVAIVAKERSMTVGIRTVNEGNADRPQVRWYLLLAKPRPRQAEVTAV